MTKLNINSKTLRSPKVQKSRNLVYKPKQRKISKMVTKMVTKNFKNGNKTGEQLASSVASHGLVRLALA